ncbi:hypothetical protein Dvina_15750 [Dactylosporangium vinaceum]|uniref:HEAT repeat protein n=1 Tax=Dactylosporangium vinaceum TaxID=53362 RepID=A0ABV5M245_9ACTN|nr:hypothetical protein [Dactylosporangium vinaceum]UAB99395.1 hypothetical protein Dvina_15750 [Dactylosporangium vinaceum]
MLRELDAVAWPDLTHAYGEADDVPDLLRRLADGEPEALHALYGNIWHQGTVYEATAFAVPFLIELLDAPAADVAGILRLLAAIAGGSSYMDVHQRYLPASQQGSDELAAQIAQELAWVAAARAAVSAGRPAYARLLSASPAEDVRAAAAYTLAALDPAATDTAALRARAADDPSPVVRASAMLALSARAVVDPAHLDDPEPLPRVAAAMAHALNGGAVTGSLAAILGRDAPAALPSVPLLPWESDDPLAWVLSVAGPDWRAQVRVLAAWLEHPDPAVRSGAVYAAEDPMRTWRAATPALAPLLAARLDDPEPAVRHWAATHLAAAGRAAGARSADALWGLIERSPGLDATAARALTALVSIADARADGLLARVLAAPDAPPAAPPSAEQRLGLLTAAAGERDPAVGWHRAVRERMSGIGDAAAELVFDLPAVQPALARLGSWATETRAAIIPAIARARPGHEQNVLIAAAVRIGAGAVPDYVAMLRVEQPPAAAIEALGGLGATAAPALPELRRLLGHAELTVRLPAAAAYARVTGDPGPLLAVAEEGLRGERMWQRNEALHALPAAGRAAGPLAPLIAALLTDDDDWTSMRAAVAYWHATGDAERAVPALLRHTTSRPLGLAAVACLGEIGPAAAAALPTLRAAIDAPDRQPHSDSSWGHDDDLWLDACTAAVARITGPGGGPVVR